MPRARWQVNVLTLQFGLNHTCMLLYVLFLLELDEYVLRGAEIVSVLFFFAFSAFGAARWYYHKITLIFRS
jgi:hypothetical protein